MPGSCSKSVPTTVPGAPRPPSSPRANNWDASFPAKLHAMLECAEEAGLSHVVSWLPHGRAFRIHDDGLFMSHVAGWFSKATQMRSIHRQLNLWGFRRVHSGRYRENAWYHERFKRGRPDDTLKMVQTKHRGGRKRRPFPRLSLPDDALNSPRAPPVAPADWIASALGVNGGGKPRPRLVSPGAGTARPSPTPLPRLDSLVPTARRDRFGPRRASARTNEPLQYWTIEPLPFRFGNEKSRCDVDDDEFSLFIGMLIKDLSEH